MSENSRNLLAGLFVGGLVGATLGILFAPKSGKETREEISRKTDEILVKTKEGYKKAADKCAETVQSSKSKLKGAIDAGVEAYRQANVEKTG